MVGAQTLWKVGLRGMDGVHLGSRELIGQLFRIAMRWQFLLGMAIFGFTTILWLDLLSRMELSRLYPLMSFTYVIAFFTGWMWLGEKPNPRRLVGILVICVGIYLVAQTGSS